jgi:hypothetical protein
LHFARPAVNRAGFVHSRPASGQGRDISGHIQQDFVIASQNLSAKWGFRLCQHGGLATILSMLEGLT